jgi:hypothetical protein
MKNIEVTEVVVTALPGALVWNCQVDAAVICLTENRRVRLVHNEKSLVITTAGILNAFDIEE